MVLFPMDTLFVFIALKRKVTFEIGIIKGWLSIHRKYGFFKVSILKAMVLTVLIYPDLPKNPGFILFLVYLLHCISSLWKLLKGQTISD